MALDNQNWDDLGRNIQNVIDRAVNSHDFQSLNQTIRQVVDRVSGTSGKVSGNPHSGNSVTAQNKNLPKLYGSTRNKQTNGYLKTACGGVIAFFSLIWLFFSLGIDRFGSGALSFSTILALVVLLCGAWLIYSGASALGRIKRFKKYKKTLGQKTHCTLEKLARSVGKSVKFVRKELWRMIDEGYFLEGHMDNEQTCLITSHETYEHFERSRLQLEEQRRQEAEEKAREQRDAYSQSTRDPRVQEVLDKGNAFVAQIRKCNDEIPGQEISEKIDRMEMLVRRIFARAEAHPEIVPDLKKLMDYYLPMTVKLLNAYAEMDAQPIQGQNIQTSKKEIEDTLDTLNLAFEKLLDSVYADTAMDISSDISVLNTLLAQEGLTEDELSKAKKNKYTI